jgi:predicted PurR-regulated permease PerM
MLGVIALGLLLAATFWIMKPFLLALVWATMITVATWPILLRVQNFLRGSRKLAVLVMTVNLLLLLILPIVLAVTTILQNTSKAKMWLMTLTEQGLPPLPDWVGGLPLVGEKAMELWAQAAAAGPEGLSATLARFGNKLMTWFVSNAGEMGLIVLNLLLTLILTAILYAKGEVATAGVIKFFRRLAGEQGEKTVTLAGRAIRAVAMGIVVTALIQSLLGGIGLWIAGVPAAGLLTAVMFLLAIAQVGVGPVLFCSVAWLFYKKITLWAVILLVWSVVVTCLDNVIRPILIKKGADLPLLLIFAGVIGGLFAFGILGLFVGPVTLAVSYTLIEAWVNRPDLDEPEATGPGE